MLYQLIPPQQSLIFAGGAPGVWGRRAILAALSALCLFTFTPLTHAETPAPAAPEIYRTTLPNGMRIICKQEKGTPLVAFDVFVRVGSSQETTATAGIGSFVARTLLASTASRSPDTISAEIANIGGSVGVTRQPDWTQISALTVADKFPDTAYLITDVLKDADFDSEVVEEKRQEILAEIDGGSANFFDMAYIGLRSHLFSETGYAIPPLGYPASIKRMSRAQLQRYYYRYYIPKNFVVVIVGNIDPAKAAQTVSDDMEDFQAAARGSHRPEPIDSPLPPLIHDAPSYHLYQSDLAQVCVMAGFRAPSMSSDDYPSLLVANALLGGMKTSRLFTNLRERQGLGYELGSFYSPQLYSGDITSYVFASPTWVDPKTKKRRKSVKVITEQVLEQFAGLQTTPPTPAELARAKHYLIGTYKIKHERIEDRAYLLGVAELTSKEGADFDAHYADHINSVTADDVQRVARRYFVHPVLSILEPDPKNGGEVND